MTYLPPGHPAVEAARRVHIARTGGAGVVWADVQAAIEALKPIRELHRSYTSSGGRYTDDLEVCRACDRDWPCATARLIYAAEELLG